MKYLTVLHIDDDPDIRFLLRELLVEAESSPTDEVEIRWFDAASVEEALMRFGRLRPDAILLDNRLDVENGVDLLPRIRNIWDCPVWILTGLAPETLYERSEKQGAAGVINKDELLKNGRQLRAFLLQCRKGSGESAGAPISS